MALGQSWDVVAWSSLHTLTMTSGGYVYVTVLQEREQAMGMLRAAWTPVEWHTRRAAAARKVRDTPQSLA